MKKLLVVAAAAVVLTGCSTTTAPTSAPPSAPVTTSEPAPTTAPPTQAPPAANLSCPDGYPDDLAAALGESRSGERLVETMPDTATFLGVSGPIEPQDGCFVVVTDGERELRMGLVPGDDETLTSLGQAMETSGLTRGETADNAVAEASYTTADGVQYVLMDREDVMGTTNLFSQTFGPLFDTYFPADQELVMITAIVGA